ncbi:MAG: hypothetical protein V4640_00310 [Verrucomicrobiota bacterium]
MKTSITLLSALCVSIFLPLAALADPFEDGMRQAFKDYKAGNDEAVTAKLRELIKVMDEKGAAKAGELFPDALGDWKGEAVKTEQIPGVGVSLTRVYVSGERRITVQVVKDSPMVAQLLPLLGNEDLIKMTNRKTHLIAGQTAIMEGDHKLQAVVDSRIYVELEGDNATGEAELVVAATQLGIDQFAKLK